MKPTYLYLFILSYFLSLLSYCRCESPDDIKKEKNIKHLKRLKKVNGGIKLGMLKYYITALGELFVTDEWDENEAEVICRQLGYSRECCRPTLNSYFAPARRRFWMDNVYCDGTEEEISLCRFDGWGQNDCTPMEAAGVICEVPDQISQNIPQTKISMVSMPNNMKLRLKGGRVPTEGRVEISTNGKNWEAICGDGWSLIEALVVCKSLSLGFASDAMQTEYFGGNLTKRSLGGVKCLGNEYSITQCFYNKHATGKCKSRDLAAVSCTDTMSDLIIDHFELMKTAHLEDKPMFFLQCAMEENCVASTAYEIQKQNDAWHLETRRLLRFTARIFNAGTADFRPAIPKYLWEWHMCHMHYHSMEVFATFDIYNSTGQRVAEGHKASFCLEDNQCLPGVQPRYACANYGDQGISVNCSDIYKYTVDCQWVDISDLDPGKYSFKVAVNPEFKVAEMSFENNAAVCDFYYMETYGTITNCVVQRP
ncbi:hypothetical protein NQ317_013875 [Molorchus minor]|uniref:protein-lysine 6-oxidase n=1 Tax=Molorchus minor TaxID=1323400 RepID=A0ABQ9K7J5_9CUCU|nr:hypothetical protein NQ317_013875 [Molorchus minor]